MNLYTVCSGRAAALTLAVLAISTLAPVAQADRGGAWMRYKHGGPAYNSRVIRHDYAPRREFVDHGSSAVPVLAGLIGGLVIGSALHSAAYAAPAPDYYYYDPYNHERFASLDACDGRAYRRHHARVVLVIDARSGECVRTCDWRDGRLSDRDSYDSRYDGDRYGRGGYDRRDGNEGDDRDH